MRKRVIKLDAQCFGWQRGRAELDFDSQEIEIIYNSTGPRGGPSGEFARLTFTDLKRLLDALKLGFDPGINSLDDIKRLLESWFPGKKIE